MLTYVLLLSIGLGMLVIFYRLGQITRQIEASERGVTARLIGLLNSPPPEQVKKDKEIAHILKTLRKPELGPVDQQVWREEEEPLEKTDVVVSRSFDDQPGSIHTEAGGPKR